ncbi:MAG: DNA polymerase Y family protein [Thermoanaerobaculia bacterium]
MRIACFLIPLFPLAARLRSEPELRGEAAAVTEGNGNAARVVAATRRARKSGIRAGMSLPQARAILPRLIARSRDEACERSAQQALLELAESFSPRVEDAGDGIVFLDLSGLELLWSPESLVLSPESLVLSPESRPPAFSIADSLPPTQDSALSTQHSSVSTQHSSVSTQHPEFGTQDSGLRTQDCSLDEPRFANAALLRLEAASLPARIGIASSKLAARIAAELPDTPVIVPEGREREFLAPLPLSRLSPELDVASTLARWGIDSIGALARLPEGEIATRLGEAGRQLHWTARGIDASPIIPFQPPPVFEEGLELEWPVVEIEPLLFVARAALERLSERLAARGYACKILDLTLRLDPDGWDARSIALPAPTRDVKTLLAIVKLDIETKPPGAPVAGFLFTAHPDQPRKGQLSLFGPPEMSPDKLMAAIARIGSIVGAERVGAPQTVDGWAPERYAVAPYDPPPPPRVRRAPRRGRGLLAVRVLRPPIPLEVTTDGPPLAPGVAPSRHLRILSIRPANPDDPRAKSLRLTGDVRVASGPWTISDGWWSENAIERDYWDIEIGGVTSARLFRERESCVWFLDGSYD